MFAVCFGFIFNARESGATLACPPPGALQMKLIAWIEWQQLVAEGEREREKEGVECCQNVDAC